MADIQFDGVKLSVAFNRATSLANLTSGENISTSFGKLSKFIASIQDLVSTGSQVKGNINFNDYTESGIYTTAEIIGTITNGPTITSQVENNKFTLIVMSNSAVPEDGIYTSQIVVYNIGDDSNFNPEIYCRCRLSVSGGTAIWGSWYKIFPSQLDNSILQNGRFPVAGSVIYSALQGKQGTLAFDGTYNATSNKVALQSSIQALDVSNITANLGRNKTLTALSETDGKISATADTIQITKSQVTDFPTLGTAAAKDYTTTVSSGGADLPTSGSVYSAISDATSGKLVASDVFGLGTALNGTDNIDSLDVGLYYWAGAENKPTSTASTMPSLSSATLIQIKNAYDAAFTQFVIPQNPYSSSTTPKVIYIRYKTNSGWQQFDTIEFASNYDTSPTSGSEKAVTSGGIYTALEGKQGTLTFDSSPTDSSTNPVTSSGIRTEFDKILTRGTEIVKADATLNKFTTPGHYWCSASTICDTTSPYTQNITDLPTVLPISGGHQVGINIGLIVIPTNTDGNCIQVCTYGVSNSSSYHGAAWYRTKSGSSTPDSDNWSSWTRLDMDSTPTSGSAKGVTSGGVYTAINAVKYGMLGTQLTAAADLNTITAPGVYYAATGGSAFTNLPSDWNSIAAFNLFVERTTTENANANRMRQILMPATNYPSTVGGGVAAKFYVRYKTGSGSGTWNDWIRFDGTVVAPASSGANAIGDETI